MMIHRRKSTGVGLSTFLKAVMPHGEREHTLQMSLRGWGCADNTQCGRPGNEMAGDKLAEDYGQIHSGRWRELQCRGDGWRGKPCIDSERNAESRSLGICRLWPFMSRSFDFRQRNGTDYKWILLFKRRNIASIQKTHRHILYWFWCRAQQHAAIHSLVFLGENSVTPIGGVAVW